MIYSETKVKEKIKLRVYLVLIPLNSTHCFMSPQGLGRNLIHHSTSSASHSHLRWFAVEAVWSDQHTENSAAKYFYATAETISLFFFLKLEVQKRSENIWEHTIVCFNFNNQMVIEKKYKFRICRNWAPEFTKSRDIFFLPQYVHSKTNKIMTQNKKGHIRFQKHSLKSTQKWSF